jgi:hypothetical protein
MPHRRRRPGAATELGRVRLGKTTDPSGQPNDIERTRWVVVDPLLLQDPAGAVDHGDVLIPLRPVDPADDWPRLVGTPTAASGPGMCWEVPGGLRALQ